ncbi:MAG: hypothetical protein JWP92_634 [Caulobacter sp.]|nr:hypothetical protein [Caulobacter sp.]
MDKALLIQLLGSAAAVAVLVALAAWAGIPRPAPRLDADAARRLLAAEFPDHAPPKGVWISADGVAAVARAGDDALILWRLGDGYVARLAPWSAAAEARVQGGRVRLKLPDAMPAFALEGEAWPPRELAA